MAVGLGFILIIPLQNYLLKNQTSQYLNVSASEIQENANASVEFGYDQIQEATLWDVMQLYASDDTLPVIGQIMIPELDLHLPILKGTSSANLLAGAGTIKEDLVMGEGNYSLASHNMKNPNLLFAPLHRAEKGMKVYITDMEVLYTYTIHTHQIIEPTKVEVLEGYGEPTLTLITCNYNGEKRLLTQGVLSDTHTMKDIANLEDFLTYDAVK